MSIKLKTQESIEKKLASLILQGKQLSKILLKKEYEENYASLLGDVYYDSQDISEMATPDHYTDLLYNLLKWQKQCLHLLSKLPLENTVYFNVLELLQGKKDKKGRQIYLTGIEIQEITVNLEAIQEDLKDGIFENIFLAIEVQSVLNHIAQAQELFDEDQYILAGLITLCSLESLLTELCRESLKDGTMPQGLQHKNNVLKGKGVITKETHKIITKLVEIRNSIAHGDSKLVSKDQVKEVIIEVKSIVRSQMPND